MAEKNALELLDADHIAVKHLFVEYARLAFAAPQDSASTRGELAAGICQELTAHAQIEEELFYPALREVVPDTADLLEEAKSEHKKVKELVSQIQAMGGTASTGMDDIVAQLACLVEHHVKEERDELFPKGKTLDLAALGGQLRERQDALQEEMKTARPG